jgi:hypothetical protein
LVDCEETKLLITHGDAKQLGGHPCQLEGQKDTKFLKKYISKTKLIIFFSAKFYRLRIGQFNAFMNQFTVISYQHDLFCGIPGFNA